MHAGGTVQVGNGGASGAITGNITNNGGLVINTGGTTTLGGSITGGGSIVQAGPGTLNLGGNSGGFSGTGQVTGGGLNVTGNIGGQWTIGSGTTCPAPAPSGYRRWRDGVQRRRAVAGQWPGNGGGAGNGTGTITVGGNLNLSPGSTLGIDLSATGSDTVQVGGSANVGGSTVRVNTISPSTSYQQGQQYTVVNAGGGVRGSSPRQPRRRPS